MAAKSGQRFIRENRAPRVHIEYEVETFGSRRKVELPFVMGVISDLSGNASKLLRNDKGELVRNEKGETIEVEKKPLGEREFDEFDMDNFEKKLEGVGPRLILRKVDNKLSAEGGSFSVDLQFSKMSDFGPGAIAKQVPALAELLEAREQLNDLMLYMDGKDGAQNVLDEVLKNPELLKALATSKPIVPKTESEKK